MPRRICTFPVASVLELINHAQQSPSHRMPWGYNEDPQPGLLLVKDSGIYLLSNGYSESETNKKPTVVYADGLNPHTNGDVFSKCQHIAGGDDFVELIPTEDLNFLSDPNIGKFCVEFSDTSLSIGHVPK